MRYYDIEIEGGTSYTSHNGGQMNPGALNVEIDAPVAPFDTPAGKAFVRIWGPGVQVISQANQLMCKAISVYGGMKPGLPLATAQASQAGLLFSGIIQPAYGNIEGVTQTLDIEVTASLTHQAIPAATGPNPPQPAMNLVLNWAKGAPISQALKQTLQTGYHGWTVNINIQNDVMAPQDQIGYHHTPYDLAYTVRRMVQSIVNDNKYPGISIVSGPEQQTLHVFDQSSSGIQINISDVIGLPTWIDVGVIQVKTVMRSDIKVGSVITLPLPVITGFGSAWRNAIQGSFNVIKVRHVGNFRQPSGDAWVTIIDANPSSPSSVVGDCGGNAGGTEH